MTTEAFDTIRTGAGASKYIVMNEDATSHTVHSVPAEQPPGSAPESPHTPDDKLRSSIAKGATVSLSLPAITATGPLTKKQPSWLMPWQTGDRAMSKYWGCGWAHALASATGWMFQGGFLIAFGGQIHLLEEFACVVNDSGCFQHAHIE